MMTGYNWTMKTTGSCNQKVNRRRIDKCRSVTFVALLCALSVACERANPPIHSVITAHGNTDWHIDTAEEFLYGTEMDGSTSATNFVPNSWTKRHMHIDMTNTAKYYNDSTKSASGQDTNILLGIDQAMLFFYAGHGSPTSWSTLGDSGTQSSMLLGNNAENNWGVLRYYWQCSCQVFAHGPSSCAAGTGTAFSYSCPEQFDGSSDSSSMRNVFERWGPALGSDLRMACGASTSAYCHASETNRIWDNYNNNSYDVADSFIYGLYSSSGSRAKVVPLCITKGNFNVTSTPLYDQSFTDQPNPVGDGPYLHLQFLSEFQKNPDWIYIPIPNYMPLLKLEPMVTPDMLKRAQFKKFEELLVSVDEIEGRGAWARIHTWSGAISILGKVIKNATTEPLDEETYFALADQYLRENGLHETDAMAPSGAAMSFQSRDERDESGELLTSQKNVRVSFKRQILVDGSNDPIPVLGEGGTIAVQMNNDGSVFATSKVWRGVAGVEARLPVKPFEQAYADATQKMENWENYELTEWRFGYKEHSGNVAQTTMGVVYEFVFGPIAERLQMDSPPQIVEVDGFLR